jgi:chromosome segregation ATPase
MSPTETLMLIGLGAALALIAVFLFSRMIWSIAMRMIRRQRTKNIPVSIINLEAQRDRLRTEHAMMATKLENTVGDIKSRLAEQTAELSRHRNKIMTMAQDAVTRDEELKSRDEMVATKTLELAERGEEIKSRDTIIVQLERALAAKAEEVRQLSTEIAALNALVSENNLRLNEIKRELDFEFKAAEQTDTTAVATDNNTPEHQLRRKIAAISDLAEVDQAPAHQAVDAATPAPEAASDIKQIMASARRALAEADAANVTNLGQSKLRRATDRLGTKGGISAITQRLRAMQGSTEN